MRTTIWRREHGVQCASSSFTGRPTARAATSAAVAGVSTVPPWKGSNSTGLPPTAALTMKWPGSPTPAMSMPTRRPTSMVSTESVMGMASLRPSSRSGCSRRATARAARPRSMEPSGPCRSAPNAWREGSIASSAARGVMDAGGGEGFLLQLLGHGQRAPRRRLRRLLGLVGRGQAQEQAAAQLVVIALVGLDRVAIERRRLLVAHAIAKLDELAVLDDGDRLARELPGRHALDRRGRRVEVLEERAVAAGQRIERAGVDAELGEPVGDEPVVLGLVAHLPGQRQLHADVVGGDEPAGGDLGGLDLVLERDLQEIGDVERALDLRLQRGVGLEAAQRRLVLGVELGDELRGRHAATPSRRRFGSSWVSVSLVITRVQRACSGCVCFASAWVVKPRTAGAPADSMAASRVS